jgi:hypothetical protein
VLPAGFHRFCDLGAVMNGDELAMIIALLALVLTAMSDSDAG